MSDISEGVLLTPCTSLPENKPFVVCSVQTGKTRKDILESKVLVGLRPLTSSGFGLFHFVEYEFKPVFYTHISLEQTCERLIQLKEKYRVHLRNLDQALVDKKLAEFSVEQTALDTGIVRGPIIHMPSIQEVFPQSFCEPVSKQVWHTCANRYGLCHVKDGAIYSLEQKVPLSSLLSSTLASFDIEVEQYNLPQLADVFGTFPVKKLRDIYTKWIGYRTDATHQFPPASSLKKSELLEQLKLIVADGKKEQLSSICIGVSSGIHTPPDIRYCSALDSVDFVEDACAFFSRKDPLISITHNGLSYDNKKLRDLESVSFGFGKTSFYASVRGNSQKMYHQLGMDELDTCGFARNVLKGLLNYRLSTVASTLLQEPIKKSLNYVQLDSFTQLAKSGDVQAKQQVVNYAVSDVVIGHKLGMVLYPLASALAIDISQSLARLSTSSLSTISQEWYASQYERYIHRPFFGHTLGVRVPQTTQKVPFELFNSRSYVSSYLPCKTTPQLTQGHLYKFSPYYFAVAPLFHTIFSTLKEVVNTQQTLAPHAHPQLYRQCAHAIGDAFGTFPVFLAHTYAQIPANAQHWYLADVLAQKTPLEKKRESEKILSMMCNLPTGFSGVQILRRFGDALSQTRTLMSDGHALFSDGSFIFTRKPVQVVPPSCVYLGPAHGCILHSDSAIFKQGHSLYKSGFIDPLSKRTEYSGCEKEVFELLFNSLSNSASVSVRQLVECIHQTAQSVYNQTADASIKKELAKDPSLYNSSAQWVHLARRQRLHQYDTVEYRTSHSQQIHDIVGVLPTGQVVNTDATLYSLAKMLLGAKSPSYISSFFKPTANVQSYFSQEQLYLL
jgi:hypothetical protein